MTGEIMPKLSAMRWPVGIVAALLLIAGVSLSWGGLHPLRATNPLSAISAFFDGDEYSGERRELEMLQAALQRIEGELHQQANARALASLRTQHEAVMQRLREASSRMPADSLPPDIRRLIEPKNALAAPVIAPVIAAVIAPVIAPGPADRHVAEGVPPRPPAQLKTGLRLPAPVTDFSSLALEQRPPWPLFTGRKPARAAPAPPAPADRADARQSSR
jgi:hypothetical protein